MDNNDVVPSCWVELTLVDLSLEVETDSRNNGTKIKQIVTSALQSFPSSNASLISHAVFEGSSHGGGRELIIAAGAAVLSPDSKTKWLQESVLKFVKLTDQYLALTSILLKSKAFYLSLVPLSDRSAEDDPPRFLTHPIIELPKTKHGKPYIPPPCFFSDADIQAYFPLNISHQYPFAGMARLIVGNPHQDLVPCKAKKSQLVGLDIVVFEDYNPRLYQSTLEFISVFQDSFTTWEWRHCILKFASHGPDILLHEFYLRWSVKEAYTKAVGLGMSIEFSSFETHLSGLDCSGQGLWALLMKEKEGLRFIGSLRSAKSQKEQLGDWEFFFKPLYTHEQINERHNGPSACACICVGPVPQVVSKSESLDPTLIKSVTTSLEGLLRWHNVSPDEKAE